MNNIDRRSSYWLTRPSVEISCTGVNLKLEFEIEIVQKVKKHMEEAQG